jgi:hypothetical protein
VIAELRDVHVVRGSADRLAVGTTQVAGASAVVALAALPFLDSSTALLVFGSILLVPGAMTAACWRFNHPEYELRAIYHGESVRLYASRDARIFGQVRRALLRATENYAPM